MKLEMPQIVSVGLYSTDLAIRGRTVTRKRRTAMFEIEIPLEPGGTSYIDGAECDIAPDVLICAKPGQTRNTRLPFKCLYVHLICREGYVFDTLAGMPDFIRVDSGDVYRELLSGMREHYDRGGDGDAVMLNSLFLSLLYTMMKDGERSAARSRIGGAKGEMIECAVNYVKNNLTSDLSLRTVAAKMGFSPIYFHNTFKTSIGKTIHEYVEEERLKSAADMLVTTDKTLAAVAYECGFSSQSYFSFAFKRRMGVTPREYAMASLEMYEREETRTASDKTDKN